MEVGGINNKWINQTLSNAKNQVEDSSFEKKLEQAMESKDETELKKVCKDFENIFMGMMYKQMKATVMKSDLIPAESGREMFESMYDEKIVEEAAKGKGIGIGDMLFKQLRKALDN